MWRTVGRGVRAGGAGAGRPAFQADGAGIWRGGLWLDWTAASAHAGSCSSERGKRGEENSRTTSGRARCVGPSARCVAVVHCVIDYCCCPMNGLLLARGSFERRAMRGPWPRPRRRRRLTHDWWWLSVRCTTSIVYCTVIVESSASPAARPRAAPHRTRLSTRARAGRQAARCLPSLARNSRIRRPSTQLGGRGRFGDRP